MDKENQPGWLKSICSLRAVSSLEIVDKMDAINSDMSVCKDFNAVAIGRHIKEKSMILSMLR